MRHRNAHALAIRRRARRWFWLLSGVLVFSGALAAEPQPVPAGHRFQQASPYPSFRPAPETAPLVVAGAESHLSGFFQGLPFLWSPADGFRFLPLPCVKNASGKTGAGDWKLDCGGSAAAVSSDGRVVAGSVRENAAPTTPQRAARWRILQSGVNPRVELEVLGDKDSWSNAYGISGDGSVIVGDAAPWDMEPLAARWVDGVEAPLQHVGEISSARFCSADGSVAIGWALVHGKKVLVRWDAAGAAETAEPPAGSSLDSLKSISPDATAVTGALLQGGRPVPFVWTDEGGFDIGERPSRPRQLIRPFGRRAWTALAATNL